MSKIVYVIGFCIATAIISNGCLSEGTGAKDSESLIIGEQCGSRVCTGKTFCCNASCSICAPLDGACTQQFCGDPTELPAEQPIEPAAAEQVSRPGVADGDLIIFPQQCGPVTCGAGTHCCNASCGICVGPGGVCTQQICNPTE